MAGTGDAGLCYLHTMVRISDVDASLDFYCNNLGMEEIRRHDSEAGRYTNIFFARRGYAPHPLDKSASFGYIRSPHGYLGKGPHRS